MVTKSEVLAIYNANRGTNYTLVSLAQELLMQALKQEWMAFKQSQIVEETPT